MLKKKNCKRVVVKLLHRQFNKNYVLKCVCSVRERYFRARDRLFFCEALEYIYFRTSFLIIHYRPPKFRGSRQLP